MKNINAINSNSAYIRRTESHNKGFCDVVEQKNAQPNNAIQSTNDKSVAYTIQEYEHFVDAYEQLMGEQDNKYYQLQDKHSEERRKVQDKYNQEHIQSIIRHGKECRQLFDRREQEYQQASTADVWDMAAALKRHERHNQEYWQLCNEHYKDYAQISHQYKLEDDKIYDRQRQERRQMREMHNKELVEFCKLRPSDNDLVVTNENIPKNNTKDSNVNWDAMLNNYRMSHMQQHNNVLLDQFLEVEKKP